MPALNLSLGVPEVSPISAQAFGPKPPHKPQRSRVAVFVALLGMLVLWLPQPSVHAEECPPASKPASPKIIRVGVSAYENMEETYKKYMSFLADLNMTYCQMPVAFQVAVGNYAEVLDWWQKGQIDIGIFAAAPVGKL